MWTVEPHPGPPELRYLEGGAWVSVFSEWAKNHYALLFLLVLLNFLLAYKHVFGIHFENWNILIQFLPTLVVLLKLHSFSFIIFLYHLSFFITTLNLSQTINTYVDFLNSRAFSDDHCSMYVFLCVEYFMLDYILG